MGYLTKLAGLRDPTVKALIVDDSVTMRAMLSGIFVDQTGYAIVGVAKDAAEGLELVKSTLPDVILIDLCMPYISGSGLLVMLQEHKRVRKVILSASNASGAMRQKLTELGATAFFDKTEIARDPQSFRDALRRIASSEKTNGGAAEPAARAPSPSDVAHAANRFPIPHDEQARIRALAAMNVANLTVDPSLDIIAQHLAQAIDYPHVAINLIDADQVWLKAAVGLERQAFAREDSFCAHALCREDPLTVPDAGAHPVFRGLRVVTGSPMIRSYVGVPIVSRDGVKLGVVCACDNRPRRASRIEIGRLMDAAKLIAAFLDDPARRQAA